MTSLLDAKLKQCKDEGRVAFIPYITAGYPNMSDTVPLLLALERGGADIIELGMPFSDPLADGPTIQKSSFVALNNGVELHHCFEFVKEARAQGLTVPVVLMGYYNPFMSHGEEQLVKDAKDATISGFIVVDLAPDEPSIIAKSCQKYGLSFIPLVAPTSTERRLAKIATVASGYVYCVSVTGITGARDELPEDLQEFLARVRKHIKLPLAVGFGLSRREHIVGVAKYAEAAVVGSAVIKAVEDKPDLKARVESLESFVQSLVGSKRKA